MTRLRSKLVTMGTFLTGVAGHHYISKVLDYKNELDAAKDMELKSAMEEKNMADVQDKLDIILNNQITLTETVDKLADKHVPESQLENVNQMLDFGAKHCQTVTEILKKGPEGMNLERYNTLYRAATECVRATGEAHEGVKSILDSLNGSNKLISDLNLDAFYEYLNSLSLWELSALYHTLMLSLLLILLFNVLSAVLGNEIIKLLKIEESFPKLTGFLRLRLKFQKYYLTLNFTLIFLLVIASILINLLVLI